MRRAFTLIEILVSVVIIFVVMSVALNITTNAKHIFDLSGKASDFEYIASVGALEDNKTSVYEKLKDFHIDNDDIIHTLKKEKLHKDENTIYSLEGNMDENISVIITLDQLKIYDKHNSLILYKVNIK